MKRTLKQFCAATLLALSNYTYGQGTFQNLDFESPMLPFVPVDTTYGFVAASNSLPGWTVYVGTNQQDRVLLNNYFLGTAVVDLLGPGWTDGPSVIEGAYSVVLQAGRGPDGNPLNHVSAAIAQTSLIPLSAMTILFKAKPVLGGPATQFGVSIAGQDISLVPLQTSGDYTLYGGDISAFAGLTRELRISAIPTPAYQFSSVMVDSIMFSNLAIPEPSTICLFGLGALLLGWRFRRL